MEKVKFVINKIKGILMMMSLYNDINLQYDY